MLGQNPLSRAETDPPGWPARPARPAGLSTPSRRGHRGREHPGQRRSGRLNLPPARVLRPGRERRGGRGAARPSFGRGEIRRAPGRRGGPGTRAPAPAPSCRPASRGAGAARHGRARAKARSAAAVAVAAPRATPPPVTVATYLGAGRPQRTPPHAGPAANCPRACALQASGPDPGQKGKQRARRPLAAAPGSAGSALELESS